MDFSFLSKIIPAAIYARRMEESSGRIFLHGIPAVPSAAMVVPNRRREEPEGIESPKPQA